MDVSGPGEGQLLSSHERISNAIASRIKEGVYPVGSTIPTELELCEDFSASRYAVRQAVKTLVSTGLVKTRRRAGTVVLRQNPKTSFGLHLETTDELDRYLQFTNLYVSNVIDRLTEEKAEVGLQGDLKDWLMLECYRTIPSTRRPISWTNYYINKEYGSIVEHISLTIGGVFPLFETVFNERIGRVEIEISATNFPDNIARSLRFSTTEPALLVIRRCLNSEGKVLAVAESYYPPHEFKYVINQHRSKNI